MIDVGVCVHVFILVCHHLEWCSFHFLSATFLNRVCVCVCLFKRACGSIRVSLRVIRCINRPLRLCLPSRPS